MKHLWLYIKWAVKLSFIFVRTAANVIGTFAILTGIVWTIVEFIILPLLLIPFGLGCILIGVFTDLALDSINKKWSWKV